MLKHDTRVKLALAAIEVVVQNDDLFKTDDHAQHWHEQAERIVDARLADAGDIACLAAPVYRRLCEALADLG